MASCHTLRSRYELIDGSVNSHPYSPLAIRYSLFASSLLIARQDRIISSLPRREEIEFAEFLIETDGLIDHPLLLVVVTHLDEAGEREILAQRMAVEAVIGQETPHVRMAGEDHAVEVVAFALEPVGAGKQLDDRGHLGGLAGFRAQPD